MAHLWLQSASGWVATQLSGAETWLAADHIARSSPRGRLPGEGRAALLLRAEGGPAPQWALIVPRGSRVLVNGRPPMAGLFVLRDRDEIRSQAGDLFYFSTETLATIVDFPGGERPVFCGRCRQRLDLGSCAVCCPSCSIWFHQASDLPCWTYSETCGFCGRATALDSGFTWIPED